MAITTDHSGRPLSPLQLADRLENHADSIDDINQSELEEDLRSAAKALREALIPKMIAEIRSIAAGSSDLDCRNRLRALIGEAGPQ